MLARSDQLLEEIRQRAERHAQARPERWRRLGYHYPFPPVRALSESEAAEPATLPRVSIILATRRVEMSEAYRRNIAAQDYPNLEVIIVLNNDAYEEASVGEAFARIPLPQLLRVPAAHHLGACLNRGVESATGQYVAKMDDDDFYGPSYISDLVLTALESGADVTGKKATFVNLRGGQEYCLRGSQFRNRWLWPLTAEGGRNLCPRQISKYCSTVAGATLFVKRDAVREFPFDETAPSGSDTMFQLACRRAGMTTYASDEFNFCYVRHPGAEGHLWKITRADLLRRGALLPSFDRGQLCV